jgi:hypothetical protein
MYTPNLSIYYHFIQDNFSRPAAGSRGPTLPACRGFREAFGTLCPGSGRTWGFREAFGAQLSGFSRYFLPEFFYQLGFSNAWAGFLEIFFPASDLPDLTETPGGLNVRKNKIQ